MSLYNDIKELQKEFNAIPEGLLGTVGHVANAVGMNPLGTVLNAADEIGNYTKDLVAQRKKEKEEKEMRGVNR